MNAIEKKRKETEKYLISNLVLKNEVEDLTKKFERFTKKLFLEFFDVYSNQIRPITGFETSTETYTKIFKCAFNKIEDTKLYHEAYKEALNELSKFSKQIAYFLNRYLVSFVCEKYKFSVSEKELIEFYCYLDLIDAIESESIINETYIHFEETLKLKEERIRKYFEINEELFFQVFDSLENYKEIYTQSVFQYLISLIEEKKYEEVFMFILKESYLKKRLVFYKFNNKIYVLDLIKESIEQKQKQEVSL